MKPKASHRWSIGSARGFALISTLLLLSILIVLIAALGTFVNLKLRTTGAERDAYSAQQSALAGLHIALGELQAAAGPDQRITAAATVLEDSSNIYTGGFSVADGRAAWTGVWKSDTVAESGSSPSYDPSDPNTREFVGWLVSGVDSSGNFALPSNPDDVQESSLTLSDPQTLFTTSDGTTPFIQAEKVKLDDVIRTVNGVSTPVAQRYFAFAVEDESVKADLAWQETPSSVAGSTDRAQALRLSATPGPDYAALNDSNGPFGSISYPISMDSSNFLRDDLTLIRDPSDLSSTMAASADWLRDQRGNITWGSKGVMADVKWGGLRRDLSLAFEMDGEAEAEDATLFNQQDGEFVGGSDRLTAGYFDSGINPEAEDFWIGSALANMPAVARFPYRDFKASGTPFGANIASGPAMSPRSGNSRSTSIPISLRGPTWWLLRDYANLYKRLSGSTGDYTMDARSYYPNKSQGAEFSKKVSYITGRGSIWDCEEDWDGRQDDGSELYIFRPARANYAPVSLGSSTIVSLRALTVDDVAVVLDMFFYFWNPYNHKITCDNLVVGMDFGLPGNVVLTINEGLSDEVKTSMPLITLMRDNVLSTASNKVSFLVKSETGGAITLEPGEVVVATTSGSAGQANLGYAGFNTTSGIVMSGIDWGKTIASGDTIGYVFDRSFYGSNTSGMRNETQLFLPDGSIDISDLTNITSHGEELQLLHYPAHGEYGEDGYTEYVSPDARDNIILNTLDVDNLIGAKQVIGVVSTVMKPANWTGNNPNPVEVFSQFNPTPVAISRDYNRICGPNQVFHHATEPDPGQLLNGQGIGYGGTSRGGFWGDSFESGGTASFPLSSIPSAPLISLVSLTHANASVMANEAFHEIGNSWSSPLVPLSSPFGTVFQKNGASNGTSNAITSHDLSWHMNDALFDRYYFSGMAPDYTISNSGYNTSESLTEPLQRFYQISGSDYRTAKANPVLVPYTPAGMAAQDIVDALDQDDGYLKTSAYSLINGAFNVNSTSVAAWESFLSANRDLEVEYSDGGDEDSSGIPFPNSTEPAVGDSAKPYWSGFSRLNNTQIQTLAENIVEQVHLRGPFMSLSDFVNRRVGTPVDTTTHSSGALQAAIDATGINAAVQASTAGTSGLLYESKTSVFQYDTEVGDRTPATGIPGEINQAELLLPLAPRLTARSDTFRIRAYGEVRNASGTRVLSKATCEAVVQRIPEYIDATTNAADNEPWDQAIDPLNGVAYTNFNEVNKTFGRRFKVVQFRWLTSNEL